MIKTIKTVRKTLIQITKAGNKYRQMTYCVSAVHPVVFFMKI